MINEVTVINVFQELLAVADIFGTTVTIPEAYDKEVGLFNKYIFWYMFMSLCKNINPGI